MLRRTIRWSHPTPRSWTTGRYRRPLIAVVLALVSLQWTGQPFALTESLQPLADGSLVALMFCYAVWWSLLLWTQLATERWNSSERIAPSLS